MKVVNNVNAFILVQGHAEINVLMQSALYIERTGVLNPENISDKDGE